MKKAARRKDCEHKRYYSWVASDALGASLYVGCLDCHRVFQKALRKVGRYEKAT